MPRTGASSTTPRRPTMVDVARHAGVSLKTVSRVVNNEPAVAQALVDRVLSAIAELGFRRNDIARNLRSGRLNATVGLLIEEIANPFYATIAAVAADIAADHQRSSLVRLTATGTARYRRMERRQAAWVNRLVSGLPAAQLSTAADVLDELIRRLEES